MTQALSYDIDSLGGNGGWGSNMNNPLLWLITLGFLGRGGGLFGNNNEGQAGVLAGETQSKLDCLQQQHNTLMTQIAKNDTDANFVTLGSAIAELGAVQRDATAAVTAQNNDLSRQLADCCCDLREGIQGVNTAIAMQTNQLVMNENNNTQRILDQLNTNLIATKGSEIRRLQDALQTQTIIANCDNRGPGNNPNVAAIAAALQGMQAPSTTASAS